MSEKKVKLSPSRVKTLLGCGLRYWFSYKAKIPEGPNNSGASRGSVAHYCLECLCRPNRKELVATMVRCLDPWTYRPLKRLAKIHARKLGVADPENFEMIRGFILTALKTDFFCEGSEEVQIERQFDIETDHYHIGGFIDKIAVYKDRVEGIDYKSSKKKFTGEEVSFNLQNYFYTLAIREMFPGRPTSFQFQFLKFPKSPIQRSPEIGDAEMEGFKGWLGHVSKYITNLTLAEARNNAARFKGFDYNWMCGKNPGDINSKGLPAYICPYKFPCLFFALMRDGVQIKVSRDRADVKALFQEGDAIEQREHPGCPVWTHLWENKVKINP